jgi:hypothetical protein
MTRANNLYYNECQCNGTGAADFLGHTLDCNIVERASQMAENYRNFSSFIAQSETEVACTCYGAYDTRPHTPSCHVIQNAELNEQNSIRI